MTQYRQHLSGDAAFKSFIPILTADIHFELNSEIDAILNETKTLLSLLNEESSALSNEQIKDIILKESELSWQLASGKSLPTCHLPLSDVSKKDEMIEDQEEIDNLYEASIYAIDSLKKLPISGRLLKNCHFIMCNSSRYEKKYPGEFRKSPIWIGNGKSTLKTAQFVPPVDDDMTQAFSDLEEYIHNETISTDVLVRAALIHYQFEMIHPFIDANGRVGRLLNTLYLLEYGGLKSPCLILSYALKKRSIGYYSMLQRVNHSGKYEAWITYFLNAIREATDYSIKEIRKLKQ